MAAIIGVLVGDVWLGTCGFDRCPSPREIQAYRPDEGGRIYDRSGRLMGRLAIVRRLNVPISQVPVHVRQAFIAAEDRRFYEHGSIDFRGLFRASLSNAKSFGVREGFSTITMQAARNSFVVNQYKNRSLAKKLVELRVARLMEKSLSKDQILQLYLNAIYMGNGVYGVEAASRDLFGKSVSNLSVTEGAMLAALPKAPSAYTPRRNPQRALARRNLVLSLMVHEGYISPDRYPGLAASRLRIARDEWRPDTSDDSFALDAVRAITDSVLKEGDEDVADISVYTTLDRTAQIAADRSVRRHAAAIQRESSGYYKGQSHAIQGAMVAIDPRTGDIRALVGGRRYERGNFNRALLAHRQPGSAFKPFVYAAALSAGYTPASEVQDEPVEVVQGRSVWAPSNYNDDYAGRITFRKALMRSANAATVRVSQLVGLPRIIDTAHRNGIQSVIPNYPAIALGAIEVTPMELVRAYAPFANGGYRVKPRLVKRIETRDGDALWTSEIEGARAGDGSARRVSADVDASRSGRLRHRPADSRLRREGNHRRQDGDDEQRDGRLVRRLHAESRRGVLVRVRRPAHDQLRRIGRSPRITCMGRVLQSGLVGAGGGERLAAARGNGSCHNRSDDGMARQ